MNPVPPIHTVYYGSDATGTRGTRGASFELYEPLVIPALPPTNIIRSRDVLPEQKCRNPDRIFEYSWRDTYEYKSDEIPDSDTVLSKCYDKDYAQHYGHCRMTITLISLLTKGARPERPAQVWKVIATGSSVLLVARIYDPLYFDTMIEDRFSIIERAVSCEQEAYRLLHEHQGTMVPQFRGIFVADIPSPGVGVPRHAYVVLLEWLPGIDLRNKMLQEVGKETVGAVTCLKHKAGFLNDVARASLQLYRCGIRPEDLMPRNVLLLEPSTPSQDDFCDVEKCPFRHTMHVDLEDSEDVFFANWDYTLARLRKTISTVWKPYSGWLWHLDPLSLFPPFPGVK
ncbi:hypothetical protein C8R47DRAFT_602083 [Mycena vitilis]|nr:hypothetical protein C8R47DRAFT_602083 [Mycena vitilis]